MLQQSHEGGCAFSPAFFGCKIRLTLLTSPLPSLLQICFRIGLLQRLLVPAAHGSGGCTADFASERDHPELSGSFTGYHLLPSSPWTLAKALSCS
ncbi:hypothetical protein AXF42_Ash012359 [Apostasia shenzhenica]|uniref:Uncharacterized protein n=1 Tax=Apostasia shenzhenica TaxID=1088818 RepID=A0A2I0ACZ4_9ASPA|nr:hypothetical protein AXF42_Ash012359 [Apostasia shenzhenica]